MVLRDWLRLSRWREWAQSKLLYCAATALLLAPSASASLLLAVVGTVALWAAFGYGINEVADRRSDRLAGKANRAAGLSIASCSLFLLLAAAGALGLALSWARDAAAPLFVLAGLVLAVAYSAPPLRLKERGALGLLAAAAAQWALPVMAIAAVEPRGWLDPAAAALALLGLTIGLRWIAVHQVEDAAADRAAGVRTFAATDRPLGPMIVGALGAEAALLAAALAFTWPQSMPAALAFGGWVVAAEIPRLRTAPLGARLHGFRAQPLREYYFWLLPGSLLAGRVLASPTLAACAALLLVSGWLGLARALERRRSARAGL